MASGYVAAASGPEEGIDRAGGYAGARRRSIRPPRPGDRPARGAAPAGRRDDRSPDGRIDGRTRPSRSTKSRPSRRSPTRPRSRSRTPASRPACESSRSWRNGNGSPARCTTALPRSSATSTPSRRPSRSCLLAGRTDEAREPAGASWPRRHGRSTSTSGRPSSGCVARSCRASAWSPRSRTTLARFAEASKIVVRVDAPRCGAPARARARGRGPGLPDRPGGADERPQALPARAGPRSSSRSGTAGSASSSPMTATGSGVATGHADRLRITGYARCASERTASARRSIGRSRRAVAAGSRSRRRRAEPGPWSRPGIV